MSELLWTNSICFDFDFKFEYESLNLNISNNLNLHLENLHFENSGKYFVLPQKEIMIFNLVRKSQQLMLICQELVLIHCIVMNQKWLKNQVWKLVTLKNQKSLLFNPLPGKVEMIEEDAWVWSHHLHLQWEFKLLAGKFTWGKKVKHCDVNKLFVFRSFWQCQIMFCLYTSSKLSCP